METKFDKTFSVSPTIFFCKTIGHNLHVREQNAQLSLLSRQTCLVWVRAKVPLGRLVLVQLRLEVRTGFPNLDWHCSRVEVRRLADGQAEEGGPGGTGAGPEDPELQVFPCDRWLRTADGDVELRSGKCEIIL